MAESEQAVNSELLLGAIAMVSVTLGVLGVVTLSLNRRLHWELDKRKGRLRLSLTPKGKPPGRPAR